MSFTAAELAEIAAADAEIEKYFAGLTFEERNASEELDRVAICSALPVDKMKKLDYRRAWYAKHKDYAKKRYAERREDILEYGKVWREQHKDYWKKRYAEDPEKYRAQQRERYYAEMGETTTRKKRKMQNIDKVPDCELVLNLHEQKPKTNKSYPMKWISTVDELPKECGKYLVAVQNELNGFAAIVSYDNDSKQWIAPYREYISHWMPLPDLPNNEHK